MYEEMKGVSIHDAFCSVDQRNANTANTFANKKMIESSSQWKTVSFYFHDLLNKDETHE